MIKLMWNFVFNHHFTNICIHLRRTTNVNLRNVTFFQMFLDVWGEVIFLEGDVLIIVPDKILSFLDSHHTWKLHFGWLAKFIELMDCHYRQISCVFNGTVKIEGALFDEVSSNQRIHLHKHSWQVMGVQDFGSLEK